MPKFYGSFICADCIETKKYFEDINFKYKFVDITENTDNLKEFLRLRDTRKEYEEIKKNGYIGIPTILMDDGKIILGEDIFKLYTK